MTRPRQNLLLLALALAALLAVSLLFAYQNWNNSEELSLQAAQGLLSDLSLDENHFTEALLRTRYGLDPNYDAITAARQDINSNLQQLRQLDLPPPIPASVARLTLIVNQENDQTESYKFLNAETRNSLRYYLFQVMRLMPEMPDRGPYSGLQHGLANNTIAMLQQVLRGSQPDENSDILGDNQHMLHQAANALPVEREVLKNLEKHSAILAEQLPKLESITLNLADSRSRNQIAKVRELTNDALNQRWYRNLLQRLVLGLLLLSLLFVLVLLLKRYLSVLRATGAQQRFLQSLTDNVGVGVLITSEDRIIFANPEAERLLEYERDALLGVFLHRQVHVHRQRLSVADCAVQSLIRQQGRFSGEFLFQARGGRQISVFQHAASYSADGVQNVVIAFQDISERKQTEDKLRQLSLVVEQSPESIIVTNLNAEIEYVNDAFLMNTGYAREEVIGRNPRMLQSGKTDGQAYVALWEALTQGQVWRGELLNRRKDGSEYCEMAIMAPIRQADGSVTHYVAIKENITEKKQAAAEINRLSNYDSVTELPNRNLLMDRLEQSLSMSLRQRSVEALILINLDRFKILNDAHGHNRGDQLLILVAARLSQLLQEGDTLARIGGDEFVLLLPTGHSSRELASQRGITVAQQVQSVLQPVFNVGTGEDIILTACLGVTLYPNYDQDSVHEVMRRADTAMHRGKDAGGNQTIFFEDDMAVSARQRFTIESELRQAIVRNELRLFLQPQVDAQGRPLSAEVLIRWQHPERGLLSPVDFIPIAEESDLIVAVGAWVLSQSCQLMAREAAAGFPLRLSVNVSPRQFRQPGFVPLLRDLIQETGAEPSHLMLEVTEGLFINNLSEVILKMDELTQLGVRFSIDDFGTGYSSLSYLKRMPIVELKIDKSFIQDITIDPNDAALVETILSVAQHLHYQVVAEGVETLDQVEFIKQRANVLFQGYYFGRPALAESWIEKWRADVRTGTQC